MGNPVMLYFYNNIVSQAWKDKFIHSHVSVAGAWGGALQIVRLFASGEHLGYNMNHYRILLPPSTLRDMQRSFTSSAFLFPSYNVWNDSEVGPLLLLHPKYSVLAAVGDKNYTLKNVEEFFNDIRYEVGFSQYQNTAHLLGKFSAPKVEVRYVFISALYVVEKRTI
ncbi:unnamed protein product [Gongylonema pulchrum]|nr:unnamed protein product [Gongylonema pulchrum]